jgi:hypothetical protein
VTASALSGAVAREGGWGSRHLMGLAAAPPPVSWRAAGAGPEQGWPCSPPLLFASSVMEYASAGTRTGVMEYASAGTRTMQMQMVVIGG